MSFEQQQSGSEEGRKKEQRVSDIEKVARFLESAQQELAEQGINVDSDMRIRTSQSSSAADDDPRARELKQRLIAFYGTDDVEKIQKLERESSGSKFEMLKTAIMYKNMKSDYIVVRSSRYDDITNNVDNVLVNRVTGTTICAIDELTSGGKQVRNITTDPEYLKKKNEVFRMNFGIDRESERKLGMKQGSAGPTGARLQYGLVKNGDRFELGPIEHIPTFLLVIDRHRLDEGLEKFDAANIPGGYDKLLLQYFIAVMKSQIDEMRLSQKEYANLPADFKKRIADFEEYIKKIGL